MTANMACPDCGGQAFQYDADHWHCLSCGLTSKPSTQSFVQRDAGSPEPAGYEWDRQQAKLPTPKVVKWGDHDPDHFRNTRATNDKAILALTELRHQDRSHEKSLVVTAVLVSFLAGAGGLWLWWLMIQQPEFILIHIGGAIALVYWAFAGWRRWRGVRQRGVATDLRILKYAQANARLLLQQQEKITLGNNILCPYCETVSELVPTEALPPEGLKHCLACHKRFYTSGGVAYPVQFRSIPEPREPPANRPAKLKKPRRR